MRMPIIRSPYKDTCMTTPQMKRAITISDHLQLSPQKSPSSSYGLTKFKTRNIFFSVLELCMASQMTNIERALWIMKSTVTLPRMLVLNCSRGSSSRLSSMYWSKSASSSFLFSTDSACYTTVPSLFSSLC